MANIRSAKKRARQAVVRTFRNSAVKSSVKTSVKKFFAALAENDRSRSEQALRRAVKLMDQAADKGVIHKNAASRQKSRLMKKFQAAFTPQGEAAEAGTGTGA